MSEPLSPNTGTEPALPQQAETAKPRCCPIPGCGGRSWVLGALLIVLALVYFNSNWGPSVPSVVSWSEDLQVALAKAKETHQPILLRFSAVWCGPCQVMQREVFSRKDVAGVLANWITVSIDADKQPSIVSSFNIEMYPTFIAIDGEGKQVLRYEGTMSADEFIRFIQGKSVSQYVTIHTQEMLAFIEGFHNGNEQNSPNPGFFRDCDQRPEPVEYSCQG